MAAPLNVDGGERACRDICPPQREASRLVDCTEVASDGGVQRVSCTFQGMCGRRPDGLEAVVDTPGPSVLGEHFAMVAHLEAASIEAFMRLAEELNAHGAPTPLIRAATRAARDEARHARLTARQAARFGASVPTVRIAPSLVRSLEALAIENTVEGCVGETFGALVAGWQAQSATDPEISTAMKSIADDETGHAELAWRVATWIDSKLSNDARLRVVAERRRAVAALVGRFAEETPSVLVDLAGLPTVAQSLGLLRQLDERLWS